MYHNVMRCTRILIYNKRCAHRSPSLSLSLSVCVLCVIYARAHAHMCAFFLRDDSDDA